MKKTVKNLITWSPSHLITSPKSAFTLAEVLITLAIIGVVAAMTIPTLISNYKKQVVETKLSKFYTTMNQAIRLSEVDNGSILTWKRLEVDEIVDSEGNQQKITTNSLEWFNKYIAPYIKIAKVEEVENDREGNILIYFLDGSLVSIGANSWLFYPDAKDYKSSIGTDGYVTRDTAISGSKYFTFHFNPHSSSRHHKGKGMEPYGVGCDLCTIKHFKTRADIGCRKDATNEAAYCTKVIQLNNWKIPKDYPFEF
ncbi:MAG: type II secretion system protein [Cyanobacteria bacterium SIG32]|nr:type II secretion system protein [Cyanobacteria bacterium SIG32]